MPGTVKVFSPLLFKFVEKERTWGFFSSTYVHIIKKNWESCAEPLFSDPIIWKSKIMEPKGCFAGRIALEPVLRVVVDHDVII